MIDIDKISMIDKLKLYKNGDAKTETPAHAFDFSSNDIDFLVMLCQIAEALEKIGFCVHLFANTYGSKNRQSNNQEEQQRYD